MCFITAIATALCIQCRLCVVCNPMVSKIQVGMQPKEFASI